MRYNNRWYAKDKFRCKIVKLINDRICYQNRLVYAIL